MTRRLSLREGHFADDRKRPKPYRAAVALQTNGSTGCTRIVGSDPQGVFQPELRSSRGKLVGQLTVIVARDPQPERPTSRDRDADLSKLGMDEEIIRKAFARGRTKRWSAHSTLAICPVSFAGFPRRNDGYHAATANPWRGHRLLAVRRTNGEADSADCRRFVASAPTSIRQHLKMERSTKYTGIAELQKTCCENRPSTARQSSLDHHSVAAHQLAYHPFRAATRKRAACRHCCQIALMGETLPHSLPGFATQVATR